jgi:hypothetical protein
LELSVEELEERIAPGDIGFSFTKTTVVYSPQ